ncbi:MAG: SCO family protein [Bacteroidota bacterium]
MRIVFFFAIISLLAACQPATPPVQSDTLPILGNRDVVNGDTVYHKIPDFSFINQDSQTITNATFNNKAYITDFFFTSCPTICPKVKAQMLRLYEKFDQEDQLVLFSHSIDVIRDTVPRLKDYANKLGIESERWHLVTGEKDAIYDIADDYFSIAIENPEAPGGFDHSGRLILVDPNRYVRAFCDGTDAEDVDRFMGEVALLLKEMKGGTPES